MDRQAADTPRTRAPQDADPGTDKPALNPTDGSAEAARLFDLAEQLIERAREIRSRSLAEAAAKRPIQRLRS